MKCFAFDPPLPVIYRDVEIVITHESSGILSRYRLVDEDGETIQEGKVVKVDRPIPQE
jgi:hypothetical protein